MAANLAVLEGGRVLIEGFAFVKAAIEESDKIRVQEAQAQFRN